MLKTTKTPFSSSGYFWVDRRAVFPIPPNRSVCATDIMAKALNPFLGGRRKELPLPEAIRPSGRFPILSCKGLGAQAVAKVARTTPVTGDYVQHYRTCSGWPI